MGYILCSCLIQSGRKKQYMLDAKFLCALLHPRRASYWWHYLHKSDESPHDVADALPLERTQVAALTALWCWSAFGFNFVKWHTVYVLQARD